MAIPGRRRAARNGMRWLHTLVAALAFALPLAPAAASAAPTPAAPAVLGPTDLREQARLANLVLVAVAAAAEGRALPPEFSPQLAEDIARRIAVNGTTGGPARLTAFAPLVPIHWERVPAAGERAPAPTADTARLRARLLGTVTVARDATPGQPARVATRPLARRAIVVTLARRDGRWAVTGVAVDSASGSLAE